MHLSRFGRTVFVGLASSSVIVATQGPALAHYVYEKHLVWETDTKCIHSRSEISHGDGAGFAKTDTRSLNHFNYDFAGNCGSRDPVPAGWIAGQVNILVYLGGGGGNNGWYLCRNYGGAWDYNTRKVSEMWTALKPYMDDPPCGARTYGNMSYSYGRHNNEWVGGGLWSGQHYLS